MALIPYDRVDWFGNDALELGSLRVNIDREVPIYSEILGRFRRIERSISSLIVRDRIVT
jgi:hypothetical protein